MKKLLFCVLLTVLFSYPVLADTSEPPKYTEGDVIVTIAAPAFNDYGDMSAYSEAILQQANAFAIKHGLELRGSTRPEIARTSGISIISLRSENKSTAELIKELSSDPDVIGAEPNYITPLDPDPTFGGCNTGYGSISLLLISLVLTVIKKN